MSKRVIEDIEKLMEEQKEIQVKIQALQEKQSRVYLMSDVEEAVNGINEYVKSYKNEVAREYLNCNIKEILIDNDLIEIIFKEENECA